MNNQALEVFEKSVRITGLRRGYSAEIAFPQVQEEIDKASTQPIRKAREELEMWETELKRLQSLAAIAANRETVMTVEIPALEEQIKKEDERIPALSKAAEAVRIPLCEPP